MSAATIRELGEELWAWRSRAAFRTSDDIPRIDHEPGWMPELTLSAIDDRRERAAEFRGRWRALDTTALPVSDLVDHRLLGSALARISWELDLLRTWERDAVFCVGQALGPYYDLLLPGPPLGQARQRALTQVLRAVPAQLDLADAHLARAGWAPLARAAVRLLDGIEEILPASVDAAADLVDADRRADLRGAGREAASALAAFAGRLDAGAGAMAPATPVGRERFVWFLRHVALLPSEPEELVAAAQREYHRAVVWETLERNRRRDEPLPPLPASAADQVASHARAEAQVRAFCEREGLLSHPAWLQRYLTAEIPPYLEALEWLGVSDDLTSATRLHSDAVSYTPRPRADLPYFYAANARDPRLGIIHEGAHHKQLALSWAHERPIRRHYYDSAANEGIAFYHEEMMLQAGLFDDAPRSAEVVHNFNRLRALRVIVDINLATGAYDLDTGARAFVEQVPMDEETAFTETAFYLATPGLAMTYLVGKLELLRLEADAIAAQGDGFSLRRFHDHVWRNGNVPFSLQRWELLGDRSDLDAIDAVVLTPEAGAAP